MLLPEREKQMNVDLQTLSYIFLKRSAAVLAHLVEERPQAQGSARSSRTAHLFVSIRWSVLSAVKVSLNF